ncbi:hypothetical protein NC652_031636 [Populus alba x Populus x berolinensis]|uniref:Uncharacterized protein n=1 Tax=Populus alba x Populus x berolinensis TaxID=444605 RepID=A0AAD6M1A5_9ROSI|nr:hypothetical protein NC652_031636 [Populus alba x Populus x berolinensis]KAJ6975602.1 hypothetical protein NC653_031442 [Populus alba x Populus x berolinensis]
MQQVRNRLKDFAKSLFQSPGSGFPLLSVSSVSSCFISNPARIREVEVHNGRMELHIHHYRENE